MKAKGSLSQRCMKVVKNLKRQGLTLDRKQLLLFSPAIIFILLGGCSVLLPEFVVVFIALSLVTFGLFIGTLTWKIVKLKRKVDGILKEFEGKVLVHAVSVRQRQRSNVSEGVNAGDSIDLGEGKKIVVH